MTKILSKDQLATRHLESKIFAARLGFKVSAVKRWMKLNHLVSILDIMNHFPGKTHDQTMQLMWTEIFEA